MTACGFTPDEIDAMPMQDVLGLLRHWREHPPTHEILAAVHRLVPAPAATPDDPSGLGDLIRKHPGGRILSQEP